MGLFRRREEGDGGRVDWLVVGLGNPGRKYEGTRHNVGFEVAALAAERWGLPKAKQKYAGLYSEGRTGPGGARVGLLLPQTFMNESGRSAGPARGSLRVPLDRVVAVHDEIDLPFGRIHARVGGGLAGHNGLKSLDRELGGRDFRRIRVGVGRPDSTDPRIVVPYVLGRFSEPKEDVGRLIADAVDELDRLVASDPSPSEALSGQ
jgi:PTH1 family peptidyl-tRNA hydrolase